MWSKDIFNMEDLTSFAGKVPPKPVLKCKPSQMEEFLFLQQEETA